MDINGVCYDTGRVYPGGSSTRPRRAELQIIRDDLHYNGVWFQGTDITRLTTAAADALKLGLRGLALAGAIRPQPPGDPGQPGQGGHRRRAAAPTVPRPAGLLRRYRVVPVHPGNHPGPDGRPPHRAAIKTIRRLHDANHRTGDDAGFAAYVADLRQRHRRKTSFITKLDKALAAR